MRSIYNILRIAGILESRLRATAAKNGPLSTDKILAEIKAAEELIPRDRILLLRTYSQIQADLADPGHPEDSKLGLRLNNLITRVTLNFIKEVLQPWMDGLPGRVAAAGGDTVKCFEALALQCKNLKEEAGKVASVHEIDNIDLSQLFSFAKIVSIVNHQSNALNTKWKPVIPEKEYESKSQMVNFLKGKHPSQLK